MKIIPVIFKKTANVCLLNIFLCLATNLSHVFVKSFLLLKLFCSNQVSGYDVIASFFVKTTHVKLRSFQIDSEEMEKVKD